jgi:hypothetical protein
LLRLACFPFQDFSFEDQREGGGGQGAKRMRRSAPSTGLGMQCASVQKIELPDQEKRPDQGFDLK